MRNGISIGLATVMLFSSHGVLFANPPGNGLPPGLQKKADRGEPLPPGWRKKLQVGHPLDRSIYDHAVLLRSPGQDGIATVRIEDERLRLILATREIVEILSD